MKVALSVRYCAGRMSRPPSPERDAACRHRFDSTSSLRPRELPHQESRPKLRAGPAIHRSTSCLAAQKISVSPAVSFTRMVAISSVLFVALAAQPAQAQQDGLSLFKNYFITGDYVRARDEALEEGASTARRWPTFRSSVAPMASRRTPTLSPRSCNQDRREDSGVGHRSRAVRRDALGQPFFGNDFGPFFAAGSNVPGSGTMAKALNWEQATLPCWSMLSREADAGSSPTGRMSSGFSQSIRRNRQAGAEHLVPRRHPRYRHRVHRRR